MHSTHIRILLLTILGSAIYSPLLAKSDELTLLRGHVVDQLTGDAIPAAMIQLAESNIDVDESGYFELELLAGPQELIVSAPGYLEERVSIVIDSNKKQNLQIGLRLISQFEETVEVLAEIEKRNEPTGLTIQPKEVLQVAGSWDNIFRTVQTLPGVTATGDFLSRLSVRGGEPDQNLTILDGIEVHNPYRLFGLTSAFNPETIDHFELTAGGFSAKYGDRLSSLLIVENRTGNNDKLFSGSTSASTTDANIILEGALPWGQSNSWLLTARRTYYDLIAERIVNQNLPSFRDLQAKVNFGIGKSGTLSIFSLHSREDADLGFDSKETPEQFADLVSNTGNDLIAATYDVTFSSMANSRTILSWSRNRDFIDFNGRLENRSKRTNTEDNEAFGFSNIIFKQSLSIEDFSVRQDFSFFTNRSYWFETGFEFHHLKTALHLEAPGDRNNLAANSSSNRGGESLPESFDSALPANRFGAWLTHRMKLSNSWTIEPGVRFDWSEANDSSTVSPRFATTYEINAATRFRTALGRYTQSPGYEKLIQSDFFVDFTNAKDLNLKYERSNHLITGIEHNLTPGMTVRIEAFYKSFDDLIVGRLETNEERSERVSRYYFPSDLRNSIPTEPIITITAANDASGRAYGLDFYLTKTASTKDTKLVGWLSYTWSRAERDAYNRVYHFDYDRRHSLNLVSSYSLSKGFSFALTSRLATGFPYTPPIGLRVAATKDPTNPNRLIPEMDKEGHLFYIPDLGNTRNLNTSRLPFYARFDVRATWRPGGETGRFELYLEIINALNRDNAVQVESQLEFDPASKVPRIVEVPTEGFPFLPSFGIRWQF